MKLISVNVAHTPTALEGGKPTPTGIFKRSTLEPVKVGLLGLEGDHIGDTENHGGPDQAVYLYSLEDYAWWASELGRDLEPGTFGENLTLEGIDFASASIGDRFKIGDVLLEVTAPRLPCVTLAVRMGDLGFAKRFRKAERPGLYCRVLESGSVQVGQEVEQSIENVPTVGPRVTALELFRFSFAKDRARAMLERVLSVPIAARDRLHFEHLLASQPNQDNA